MAHDNVPDDFDWVAAQAQCNPATAFDRLRAGVEEDVRRRNGLLGRDDGWTFEFAEDDEGFDVSRAEGRFSSSNVAALVRFERAGPRINVRGDEVEVDFTAVLTLDAGGLCRFLVGEAMYSEWEIRRMALEQLFFEEAEVEE
jgi:hypothetical protein